MPVFYRYRTGKYMEEAAGRKNWGNRRGPSLHVLQKDLGRKRKAKIAVKSWEFVVRLKSIKMFSCIEGRLRELKFNRNPGVGDLLSFLSLHGGEGSEISPVRSEFAPRKNSLIFGEKKKENLSWNFTGLQRQKKSGGPFFAVNSKDYFYFSGRN